MNDILGAGEERRSEDGTTTRFRPRYRALSPDEIALHDAIKDAAQLLCNLFDKTAASRERSLAITKLEESVMWVVKGLTGAKQQTPGAKPEELFVVFEHSGAMPSAEALADHKRAATELGYDPGSIRIETTNEFAEDRNTTKVFATKL